MTVATAQSTSSAPNRRPNDAGCVPAVAWGLLGLAMGPA